MTIRRRLLISMRSILVGWPILLLLTFLPQWPLHKLLNPYWFATARLGLNCAALAATGWAIGRVNRSSPIFAVLVFALTLCVRDFSALLDINVPWLFQLTGDALRDSLYLSSLIETLATHALDR